MATAMILLGKRGGARGTVVIFSILDLQSNVLTSSISAMSYKQLFSKISDLLGGIAFAGNVVVPSQGLLIFGGEGNSLTTSQNLKSVGGVWETGPQLFEDKPVAHHCVVQVKTSKN